MIREQELEEKFKFRNEEESSDSEGVEGTPSAWDLLKQDKLTFLRYESYVAPLTLESHPGKALVFGDGSTIFHGGWNVLWA